MRLALILVSIVSFAFAQQIPRPEHPQPQFMRNAWVSLNGPWAFEFDDAGKGLQEDWAAAGRKFSKSIVVPFCFESSRSGIGDTSFHPVVWYQRSFTVPAEWKGRSVLLNFGAVDYQAEVWVNGRSAGSHEGGNTPFKFDVTPMLKAGANTVTVRAWDPPTDRAIPRGKQYWEPKSRSIFYTRTSGIWQSVWLEATGASRIDSLKIDASTTGAVDFQTRIANPEAGLTLAYTVKSGETVVATGTGAVSDGKYAAAGAFVRSPRLWSVERPNLYDVTLQLKKGETVIDMVQSYFGFRKIGLENGRVTINGRPVYLKFVLDQGYWPESLLTPPSDEAIQYDIRMTKEMGFNGARKHQKLEDPRFLYWADKMGFLVSDEMANAYLFDEQYVQRFQKEWMEAVERDINHPSIIIWAPLNESWGVPDVTDPRQQSHLRALYHMTKSMDPSRLVIDNEGWQHTEATDLFAVHDYTANYDGLKARWAKVEVKPGAALPSHGMNYLAPGNVYNGSPLYLSEFGGIAYILPGSKVPAEAWGYSGVEKTPEAALGRLSGQYDAIAQSPIMGICYTQITDVEQEINGLMSYDRKPKFDVKKLKELNDRLK
ncbi:glycoside hydrolase family 2 protein [Paludibaculum fermentans]|uniref:glycoside hydrolase family 2 protein n=1 Tax=Paludibaculum fermentans TaxID=1473598 RepID=UPI003EBE0593